MLISTGDADALWHPHSTMTRGPKDNHPISETDPGNRASKTHPAKLAQKDPRVSKDQQGCIVVVPSFSEGGGTVEGTKADSVL